MKRKKGQSVLKMGSKFSWSLFFVYSHVLGFACFMNAMLLCLRVFGCMHDVCSSNNMINVISSEWRSLENNQV